MMRIIEAFWESDGLRVWGVSSEGAAVTSSRKRVRPHPYALDHDTLAVALERWLRAPERPVPGLPGSVSPRKTGHTDRNGRSRVWLPGIPRHPMPPPKLSPLPDVPRVRPSDVGLRQWEVPTLTLEAAEALTLLDAVVTPSGEPSGDSVPFAPGRSLHHFASVLEAAKAVVSTKRVLPQLVEECIPQRFGPEQAEPVARWRPILDAPVGDWLRETARAWPPIARVRHDAHDSTEGAGDAAIADVLSALCAFTDRLVRERLSDHLPAIPRSPQLRHLWIDALTQDDGRLGYAVNSSAQAKTLAKLRESLQSWFVDAHQQAGTVRLAFRLVEPVLESFEEPGFDEDETFVGGTDWRLELWAQSVEEPSLMVPLSEIWAGTWRSATADWLPKDPSPVLLRALGQAARVYSGLSQVLHKAAPDHIDLDLDSAVDFLTTHAPALDDAGFGVLLPPWVGERRVGVKLTARQADGPRETSSGIGQTLVDFDFRAAVGDVELSAAELEELARLKQPLVRLRGEWARLNPKELQAAADYLTRHGHGTVDIAEAVRMAVAPEPGRPDLVDVEADGELGALLNGAAEHTFAPMAEPTGFTAELRPYQQRGAAWLRYLDRLGLGAILADDMGLGKTVQLLALLADERADGADSADGGPAAAGFPAPTLLICPTSVIGNWRREAARFAPKLSVHLHHGSDRPQGGDFTSTVAAANLVVTTYGVALRDTEELAAITWARIVCDEAQAIKNSSTRQARAVRSIPAPSRIALTGTPVENHLGELWSIMEFSNPGLLGPRAAFDKGIAAAIERDPADSEGSAAAARLQRVTAPFVLRRTKTDTSIISDLPEKQEIKTWCTLTTEQASLYKATVAEMTTLIEQAEGMQRKGLVLATMTKLKQVCNHPAHLIGDGSRLQGRSGKLEHLRELLTEVAAEGDKALCFTQYTDFGDRLAPYLRSRLDVPVLWMHGGVPRKKREELVERFQNEAGPMVFLLSLKAAGTGMNLTAANQVIHFDRWWNPAVEDQATDRAFRIGQCRNVQVRKMICMGTLEERIDEMIDRKKRLSDAVVGSGEDWLSELSVDELRDVIRLAPEAVTG